MRRCVEKTVLTLRWLTDSVRQRSVRDYSLRLLITIRIWTLIAAIFITLCGEFTNKILSSFRALVECRKTKKIRIRQNQILESRNKPVNNRINSLNFSIEFLTSNGRQSSNQTADIVMYMWWDNFFSCFMHSVYIPTKLMHSQVIYWLWHMDQQTVGRRPISWHFSDQIRRFRAVRCHWMMPLW